MNHSQVTPNNQNFDSEVSKPFQLQIQKIARSDVDEEEEAKQSHAAGNKLSEVDCFKGSNSEPEKPVFNERNQTRVTTKKKTH